MSKREGGSRVGESALRPRSSRERDLHRRNRSSSLDLYFVTRPWFPKKKRKLPNPAKLRPRLERAVREARDQESWLRTRSVTALLVADCGPWIKGWCWGQIDGGPVRRWCCADHSFLQGKPEEEPGRTVDLILAGIEDWDAVLDECEELFARLVVEQPSDLDLAALELVNFAVDKTEASDAWYNFCHDVISWFLQHRGVPEKQARGYARKALKGQFESWVSPTSEKLEAIAESFRDLAWRALASS